MNNYRKFLLATFLTIFLSGLFTPAQAQTERVVLNNDNNAPVGQLKIIFYDNGRYHIQRKIGSGDNWQNQFFVGSNENRQHLLALRIDNTTYVMRNTRIAGGDGSGALQGTRTVFNPIYNNWSQTSGTASTGNMDYVNSGNVQYLKKRFISTFNSQQFIIDMQITYDKSNPGFVNFYVKADLSRITGSHTVRLAYGFDSYLGGNDNGYAYILPDYSGWNGTGGGVRRNLSQGEVNKLRLVAARNNTGGGVVGFVKVDRDFDFAHSADKYGIAAPYNMVYLPYTYNSINYSNTVQFGDYSGGADNGVGVGFFIPSGQVTEFNTGLTFVPAVAGDLSFYWNTAASPNLTVAAGNPASLKLDYFNMSPSTTDIAVKADLPTQLTTAGTYTNPFSPAGTVTWIAGGTSYQVTGAGAAAANTNYITNIPVNTSKAGIYTITTNSFTDMAQMMLFGDPATLTVTTEASIADPADVEICGDTEHTVRVKLQDGVTAKENVQINLSYSNDANFVGGSTYKPASVTIPAEQNYIDFQVKSIANPTGSTAMTITLTSTDKTYAPVVSGTGSTVKISAGCSGGFIHVNPHIRGRFY